SPLVLPRCQMFMPPLISALRKPAVFALLVVNPASDCVVTASLCGFCPADSMVSAPSCSTPVNGNVPGTAVPATGIPGVNTPAASAAPASSPSPAPKPHIKPFAFISKTPHCLKKKKDGPAKANAGPSLDDLAPSHSRDRRLERAGALYALSSRLRARRLLREGLGRPVRAVFAG